MLFKAKTLCVLLRVRLLKANCAAAGWVVGDRGSEARLVLLRYWYILLLGGERGEGKEYGLVRGAVDFWPPAFVTGDGSIGGDVFGIDDVFDSVTGVLRAS